MLKIAFAGRMRSGKDTLASFFAQEYGTKEFTFKMGIDNVIDTYFPDAKAHGKPRGHYQKIGTDFRALDPRVWINYTMGAVDGWITLYPNLSEVHGVMVTDLRQPNEEIALREAGFVIVKVEADKETRIARMKDAGDVYTEEQLNHHTETNVDLIRADYTIDNNGSKKDLYIQFMHLKAQLEN